MRVKTNLKPKSRIIDPVPLADIVVLFVVFFVLTFNFFGARGVSVNLPHVDRTDLYRMDMTAVILRDGVIFVADRKTDIRGLEEYLRVVKPKAIAIEAEAGAAHAAVLEIIACARKSGIKDIVIATAQ